MVNKLKFCVCVLVRVSVNEKAYDNMSQACHDIESCRAGRLLLYNPWNHVICCINL